MNCLKCAAGSFTANPGLTVCLLCAAGSYQPATGASLCSPCQTGANTWNASGTNALVGSTSASACLCNHGYVSTSNVCSACPAGKYIAPGTSVCLNCPAGTFSTALGATAMSVCQQCLQGSYSNVTYAGANASTACKCMPGYTGMDGDYCTPCDRGTFKSVIGSSPCVACLVGHYQSATAAVAGCVGCPVNSTTLAGSSSSETSCLCNAGYGYSGPSPFVCTACTAGQYKNSTSNTDCIGCLQGTYNPNSASTSVKNCLACPGNTTTAATTSASVGFTAPSDCTCNKGYEGTGPGQACTACVAGSYQDAYATVMCIHCGYGQYGTSPAAPKLSSCLQCPPNTMTASDVNPSITACKCLAGYTAACDGVACSRCPPGTYKDVTGSTPCTPCPKNTYQVAAGANSSTQCLQCTLFSQTKTNGSRFQQSCLCAPGYFQDSTHTCSVCPVGYYKNVYSNDACLPCGLGMYADSTGMTTCKMCAGDAQTTNIGKTNGTDCLCNAGYTGLGSANCSPCAAGKYKTALGGQTCIDCAVGYYSPVTALAAPTCVLCPDYSTTVATGSDAVSKCVCGVGFFDDNRTVQQAGSALNCVPCPRGKFRQDLTSAECLPCPVGTYSSVNHTADGSVFLCIPCLAGMTTQYTGSMDVTDCMCGFGYYSKDLTDPLDCLPCAPGSYSDMLGPYPCDLCSMETYAASSASSVCTSCQTGSITLQEGSNSSGSCLCDKGYEMVGGVCVMCKQGYFKASPGDTPCMPCAAATYASAEGSTACSLCALFATASAASTGSPGCTCIAGYYGSNGDAQIAAKQCLPCPVGTYKSSEGDGACVACPSNTTTAAAASTSIQACLQCRTGAVTECTTFDCACRQCTNCTLNQFLVSECNATHDAVCSNCTACHPGSYISTPCGYGGPPTCSCCSPGSYSVFGTASVCLFCPTGTYASATCATSCTTCGRGTYQTGSGMMSEDNCTQCEAGKYQRYTNNCSTCDAGKYQDVPGSTACKNCSSCTPGKYVTQNCTAKVDITCDCCRAGTYTTKPSQLECALCSAGTYSNRTCTTYCDACEAGKYSTGVGVPDYSCSCCSTNQYQTATGQSVCSNCVQGTYSYDSCCDTEECCLSCLNWNLTCPGPRQCSSSVFQYQNGSWQAASRQVALCPPCQAGKYLIFNPVNREDPTDGSFSYLNLSFGRMAVAASSTTVEYSNIAVFEGEPVDATLTVLDELGLSLVNFLHGPDPGILYNVSAGPSSMRLLVQLFVGDGQNQLQLPLLRFGVYGLNVSTAALRVYKSDGLFGFLSGADLVVQETEADVLFQYLGGNSAAGDSNVMLYYASTDSVTLQIESSTDSSLSAASKIALNGDQAKVRETDFEKPVPLNPTLLTATCTCTACSPGKFATMLGAMSEFDCVLCNAGTYSANSSSTSCDSCPAGSYTAFTGSTALSSCALCDPGKYTSLTASSVCIVCDTGKFMSFSGGIAPGDCGGACAKGQYFSANKTCSYCSAGTYSSAGVGCLACATGTYSSGAGAITCSACLQGTYAFYPQSTSCFSSHDLANVVGLANACPNCVNTLGYYYAQCANGSYTTALFASSCILCAAGTFASAPGSVICNACPAAQYTTAQGASSCLSCSSGTYSTLLSSCVTTPAIPTTSKVTAPASTTTAATTRRLHLLRLSLPARSAPLADHAPLQDRYLCSGCAFPYASQRPDWDFSCPELGV